MDYLVLGIYVLSLMACCLCLWVWYELDSATQLTESVRDRIADLERRLRDMERRRR